MYLFHFVYAFNLFIVLHLKLISEKIWGIISLLFIFDATYL